MLIILGLLVCCAVTFTVLHARKQGAHKAIATVATGCAVVLSAAFLFYFVVLIKPDPMLNAIHADIASAMVVGSVAMAATAFICGCTALVCVLRKIEGWISVFLLLAAACVWQGGTMLFLLFLHREPR